VNLSTGTRYVRHDADNTWDVIGSILCPEDVASSDTTRSAESSHESHAERALPLPADVHTLFDCQHTSGIMEVTAYLIGHDERYVTVDGADSDEGTNIASPRVGHESDNTQPDQAYHSDRNDYGRSQLFAITVPRGSVDEDSCKGVRWCIEALRSADREAERVDKNDGEVDLNSWSASTFAHTGKSMLDSQV